MKTFARAAIACMLLLPVIGCKRQEKVSLEPTDEAPVVLTSTVHMGDPRGAIQLLKGFYEIEQSSWRWTAGKFSLTLKCPHGAAKDGARLVANFALPDAVASRVKTTTLTASIGGSAVGSKTYSSAGDQTFKVDVPASLLTAESVTVDFTLDKYLTAGSADARELGLVVSSIGLETK